MVQPPNEQTWDWAPGPHWCVGSNIHWDVLNVSVLRVDVGAGWWQGWLCANSGGPTLIDHVATRAQPSQLFSPPTIPFNYRRALAKYCRGQRRRSGNTTNRTQQNDEFGSRLTWGLLFLFWLLFFLYCGFSLHCFLLLFSGFTFPHCKVLITSFTLLKIRIIFWIFT